MSTIPPSQFFPNYQSSAEGMTFSLVDTNALDEKVANQESGDAREIIRSLVETAYQGLSKLPQSNKPKGVSIVKSSPNFVNNEKMEVTYTLTFSLNLDSASIPLIAEPNSEFNQIP